MEHFLLTNFTVDSEIDGRVAATAARNLDRIFGGQMELGEDKFILTRGSTPSFCYWALGTRWGLCYYSPPRITEWDGEIHITL